MKNGYDNSNPYMESKETVLQKYMVHIGQISDSNKQYATKPHIDCLR